MDANVTSRKRKSRDNTKEEKRNQRKQWKKKKRESAMKVESKPLTNEIKIAIEEQKRTVADSKKTSPSSSIKVHSPGIESKRPTNEIIPKEQPVADSRGALMLRLAKAKLSSQPRTEVCRPQQPMAGPLRRDFGACKKQIIVMEKRLTLKELEPAHIDYLSSEAVGSGSYGQCYRARYRGIDVIVKKMIYQDTTADKVRAKREVIHEAEVLTALEDHSGLPMIIGITTCTGTILSRDAVPRCKGTKHNP